jgi:hypothetical protein
MLASGIGLITVRWQKGLWGLIRGLEKNGFAGVNYSMLRVAGSTLGMLLIASPFAGVLRGSRRERLAHVPSILLLAAFYRRGERDGGPPWWYFATFPIGTLLFLVSFWRSAVLALWRGGIRWRDTFYPLDQLKRKQVPDEPRL